MRRMLSLTIALWVIGTTGFTMSHAEEPANAESQLLRDMQDLLNITKAIHLFANDHDGRLPRSLGETLPYIEDWTSWTESEKPKATSAEKARLYLSSRDTAKKHLPDQVTADWINENASYIYLAKPESKLTDYTNLSTTVIAHGKLDEGYAVVLTPCGKIVRYPLVMLDAHAESQPKEEITKLLETSDLK